MGVQPSNQARGLSMAMGEEDIDGIKRLLLLGTYSHDLLP